MFNYIRKYRNLLSIALVSFYLAAGFHVPLTEGLHYISHLDDLIAGGHDSHSLQSHHSGHNHDLLKALEILDENDPHGNVPVNETSEDGTKKIPQLFYANHIAQSGYIIKLSSLFSDNTPFKAISLSVPVPPPRV